MNEACVYVDGGTLENSSKGVAACAAVVVDEADQVVAEHALELRDATNNIAEYRGLLLGTCLARMLGYDVVYFVSDSQLVVRQVSGLWAINDAELGRLHGVVTSALFDFEAWSIQHVTRDHNKRADYLCNRLLRPKGSIAQRALPSMTFMRSEHVQAGWPRSAA